MIKVEQFKEWFDKMENDDDIADVKVQPYGYLKMYETLKKIGIELGYIKALKSKLDLAREQVKEAERQFTAVKDGNKGDVIYYRSFLVDAIQLYEEYIAEKQTQLRDDAVWEYGE